MYASSSSRINQSSQGSGSSFPSAPSPQSQQPQPLLHHERRNLSNRKIHSGRQINLPEPANTLFFRQLEPFGWEGVPYKFSHEVNHNLVREFYERLVIYSENNDNFKPAITTSVAGIQIVLNRAILSTILGVADEGECIFFKKKPQDFKDAIIIDPETYYQTFANENFSGGRMFENHLLEQYRNLNVFIESNILPKSGYNNSVSKYQGFIIHCIAINRKLNLSYILLKYMEDIIHNQTIGLGYGGLLMTIFTFFGINVNIDTLTPSRLPISQMTINMRNSHPFFNRPQENEEEPLQQPEEPPQEQQDPHQQQEQGEHYQSYQTNFDWATQGNNLPLDLIGEDMHYDLTNYRY